MSLKLREEETKITIHISGYGKCYLKGNEISLFTFLNIEKRIRIIIVNRSLRPARKVKVLLTSQSEFLLTDKIETKTYGVIKAKQVKTSTFAISSKKIGNFTLFITLQVEEKPLATFPIKVQVMSPLYKEVIRENNNIPKETCILGVHSSLDVTFSLKGDKPLPFQISFQHFKDHDNFF
ncbi:hypothetical protein LCGC14_0574280 [marine sediment metagenome]|uniref:Uncharacterized protein n=1 Tax=marine sediment metagenome TaxID=412755 RepID=A0A0F9U4K1_9ZZZZ